MASKKDDYLRNQERPSVMGHELNRATLTPVRTPIDVHRKGDYGADPLGGGKFKMVPSGDIVDYAERCRRLAKDALPRPVPVGDSLDKDTKLAAKIDAAKRALAQVDAEIKATIAAQRKTEVERRSSDKSIRQRALAEYIDLEARLSGLVVKKGSLEKAVESLTKERAYASELEYRQGLVRNPAPGTSYVKRPFGKPGAGRVTDRVRLHRALDAVMDARAKDAEWKKLFGGRTLSQANAKVNALKTEDRKLRSLGGKGNYADFEVRKEFEGPGHIDYAVWAVLV